MLDVECRDGADVVYVKYAEGIMSVEVRPGHGLILGNFHVLIKVDLLAEHADYTSFCLLPNWLLEPPRSCCR